MQSTILLRGLVPDLNPTQYKVHFAVWNGTEHPLDVFARSRSDWEYWNRYRPGSDEFKRQFIFSLMQVYTEPDRWLFGGVYEVVGRQGTPAPFTYEVELREEVLPGCIGRLKLAYHRPPGRRIRLNLENHFDHMEVAEILPLPYTGEPFPGHGLINHSLRQLQVIYSQNRPDWRGALQYMKGVYVIHDHASGKPYVGSAYGDTGIWARWGQYADSLHGGDLDLRALVRREGDEYARDNLTFALLEFWPPRVSDDYVREREAYWKRVLMSREFGHNKN